METNLMLTCMRSALQALGFTEPAKQFIPAGVVTFVCNQSSASESLITLLEKLGCTALNTSKPIQSCKKTASGSRTNVYIFDLCTIDPQRGLSFPSNLNSYAQTRQADAFVPLFNAHENLAVHALDLGTDDLMIGLIASNESSI